MKAFVLSYLATAAWVTCDSATENHEFTRQAKKNAAADCQKFVDAVIKEFGAVEAERLLNIQGNDLTHLAPHDFYLTRNRHGAGFWDKEDMYGVDAAKRLTTISHQLKESNAYHVRGPKSKLEFD